MSQKLSSESIKVRPTFTVYKALNPELYDALVALPDNVRSEYILAMLKWASINLGSPSPAHLASDGNFRPVLPSSPYVATPPAASATTTKERTGKDVPSITVQKEAKSSTKASAEKPRHREDASDDAQPLDAPRGLEALGFTSLADLGDAFDYSTPPSGRSST